MSGQTPPLSVSGEDGGSDAFVFSPVQPGSGLPKRAFIIYNYYDKNQISALVLSEVYFWIQVVLLVFIDFSGLEP